MELGFTCNSATNGNCTQISWLVNVLTKIQSSLHFSLHSRLRAFPVMCLPGFIPIWETEISRVRMFPENSFPSSYIPLFVLVSSEVSIEIGELILNFCGRQYFVISSHDKKRAAILTCGYFFRHLIKTNYVWKACV